MSCKLTKGLDNKLCKYALAGVSEAYLANWFPPVDGDASVEDMIAYKYDADGNLEGVFLPNGESFYRIVGAANSTSYGDVLLEGGNGTKYRQHTLNTIIEQNDLDIITEGDAISLGRFIAVVIDKSGMIKVLGRTGGLIAPAGGFDYNSGAAEADATGWTTILQGSSTEIAPIVKDKTVITPIYKETVTP